jgi:hypothetical protein
MVVLARFDARKRAQPWWNPAVEEQACDRVHRLGQQRNVKVYRFACEKTVEDKLLQLQVKLSAGRTLSLTGLLRSVKGVSLLRH